MPTLDRYGSSSENMREFQRERLEMEVTELVCRLMEEQGISRAELARRLGKSSPFVTKLLRDGSNMTLKTISDIFYALDRSLRVVARPVSVWSPPLMVSEAPHVRASVVSGEGFRYATADTFQFNALHSSVHCLPPGQNPPHPEAA